MPEAICYRGQPNWENAAIGGTSITIFFDDLKLILDGGFGQSGTARLVCPMNPTTHGGEIEVAAGGWSPAAIIGKLPLNAPCNDNGNNPWRIEIEPDRPTLEITDQIQVDALEGTIWVEPVHIWRLPWGYGYPPVGHR